MLDKLKILLSTNGSHPNILYSSPSGITVTRLLKYPRKQLEVESSPVSTSPLITLIFLSVVPTFLKNGCSSAPIVVWKYLGFSTALPDIATVRLGQKIPELKNLPKLATSSAFTVQMRSPIFSGVNS